LNKTGRFILSLVLMVSLAAGMAVVPVHFASADGTPHMAVIDSLLSLQVEAKLHMQEAGPLDEGSTNVLNIPSGDTVPSLMTQKIFLYSNARPSSAAINELQTLGLSVYGESWVPPVGRHPNGFVIAEMPVDKLYQVAALDYVVRMDTAERYMSPMNDLGTQAMNSDDLWSTGTGYDGTGVTIAVLDSGLDLTHSDIPTPVAYKDNDDYPTLDDDIANHVTAHMAPM
jgi:subtilisin family serine protease